jgi:sterol desaturase/sphingolipid hydroxylase (fatty acid hydroxylase superfamily)
MSLSEWHRNHFLRWKMITSLANVRLHPIDKLLGDCFSVQPDLFFRLCRPATVGIHHLSWISCFLNRWIIPSPQFHHWHHDNDARSYNKNFAPHLVIFDVLFCTVYFPVGYSMPAEYGIPDPVPEGFWGQIIYRFRPMKVAEETAGLFGHMGAESSGPEATGHLS